MLSSNPFSSIKASFFPFMWVITTTLKWYRNPATTTATTVNIKKREYWRRQCWGYGFEHDQAKTNWRGWVLVGWAILWKAESSFSCTCHICRIPVKGPIDWSTLWWTWPRSQKVRYAMGVFRFLVSLWCSRNHFQTPDMRRPYRMRWRLSSMEPFYITLARVLGFTGWCHAYNCWFAIPWRGWSILYIWRSQKCTCQPYARLSCSCWCTQH